MPVAPAPYHSLRGSWLGEGTWIDIATKSRRYRIRQCFAVEDEALLLVYSHDFFEEGRTSDGSFRFEHHGANLFSVWMQQQITGNGYMFDDYLHYFLQLGGIYVQASYRLGASGLTVHGSSSTNAEGNFIAWREELIRHGAASDGIV